MLNWRISPIVILLFIHLSIIKIQKGKSSKFRQTINFYYKILFILWKYWLLNSHNSKLVAGGYLFWEWKLQLFHSVQIDLTFGEVRNSIGNQYVHFSKISAISLRGWWPANIHRSEKNWKVARFLIKACKMQISNIYIGGGKLDKLMTFLDPIHYFDFMQICVSML